MKARLRDVADALLGLSYIDMIEMGDSLVAMIKADQEDQLKFDPEDRDNWADRLRWWAENRIDAEDSQ